MTEQKPLAGLNIVVTRPREQAAQLATDIEKLGGRCVQFPLLEITPLADNQPLLEAASRLREYQLLIFISPNAVRYGMQAIQHVGGLPDTLQIATVGLGSARALQEFGVKNIISPQQRFDSESLLAMPELQQVSGKKILIFRGDQGRELLGDTLKSRGAQVEYVACYHRGKPQHDINTLLEAKPDAICISSSEALVNLAEMLDPAQKTRLAALPLFVSHERIAAAATGLGWQQVITVAAGNEGLLAGLAGWAQHNRGHYKP